MDNRYINKIPDSHLKGMKPCWKCGRLPVIYSYTGYWNQVNYICCPNDDCDNKVLFNKRMNDDTIGRKNKGKKMYFCHSKYVYEYESSYCL